MTLLCCLALTTPESFYLIGKLTSPCSHILTSLVEDLWIIAQALTDCYRHEFLNVNVLVVCQLLVVFSISGNSKLCILSHVWVMKG